MPTDIDGVNPEIGSELGINVDAKGIDVSIQTPTIESGLTFGDEPLFFGEEPIEF